MRRRRIARRTDHRPSRSAASCPQRPARSPEPWALARSPPTLGIARARHARACRSGRAASRAAPPRAPSVRQCQRPTRASSGHDCRGTRGRGEGGADCRGRRDAGRAARTGQEGARFDARGAEEGAGGSARVGCGAARGWEAVASEAAWRKARGWKKAQPPLGCSTFIIQPPLGFPTLITQPPIIHHLLEPASELRAGRLG